jgi:biotin carboxyl carrier protein
MSLMEFEFLIDGAPRTIGLEERDQTIVFRDGEAVLEAEVRRLTGNELLFFFGGRTARIYLTRDGDRTHVSIAGRTFVVTEAPSLRTAGPEGEGKTPEGTLRVRSPMPGKVIKLGVREGDDVRRNQTLIIVEAMKMENEIQSPSEGTVKKIHVAVGELVDSEKPLIEIESKK